MRPAQSIPVFVLLVTLKIPAVGGEVESGEAWVLTMVMSSVIKSTVRGEGIGEAGAEGRRIWRG
jgi:hypothetical protein